MSEYEVFDSSNYFQIIFESLVKAIELLRRLGDEDRQRHEQSWDLGGA